MMALSAAVACQLLLYRVNTYNCNAVIVNVRSVVELLLEFGVLSTRPVTLMLAMPSSSS